MELVNPFRAAIAVHLHTFTIPICLLILFVSWTQLIQDAGSRLRQGAKAMRAHAGMHDFFFAQLAQLQQCWTVQRSQPGTGALGHFQVDVALPLKPHWQLNRKEQQPNAVVDIVKVGVGFLAKTLHFLNLQTTLMKRVPSDTYVAKCQARAPQQRAIFSSEAARCTPVVFTD